MITKLQSTAMQISLQPRFNTNLTGFRDHSRIIYVGLAWFTTTTDIALGSSGTVGKGMGTTADNNIICHIIIFNFAS
ncbi:MAG TPA: hypothetical protein VI278_11375 [Nitrososphaeraceae archaeon]